MRVDLVVSLAINELSAAPWTLDGGSAEDACAQTSESPTPPGAADVAALRALGGGALVG